MNKGYTTGMSPKANQRSPEHLVDHHPIQVVSRYTGLSTDLIRIWEKRYHVVTPARARSGRRLYSDADIQRLSLLRQLTQFGRRISEVARLPVNELAEIARRDEDAVAQRPGHGEIRPSTSLVMELFDQCLDAVTKLDTSQLQTRLNNASKNLGIVFLIEDLVSPLLYHIEEECRQGELSNCHQRLFTEALRGYLLGLCARDEAARNDFVACSMAKDPALTALRAAVVGNTCGWNPVYLGECATCDEIIDAAGISGATAVVVSFDDTGENPRTPNEMRRLVQLMPARTHLVINAPEACAYSSVLSEAEAQHAHNFGELRLQLERLAPGDD